MCDECASGIVRLRNFSPGFRLRFGKPISFRGEERRGGGDKTGASLYYIDKKNSKEKKWKSKSGDKRPVLMSSSFSR